jgi:hypothetical protein
MELTQEYYFKNNWLNSRMRENFRIWGWYFTKPYKIVFNGTFNKEPSFLCEFATLYSPKQKEIIFLKEENVDKKDMVQS